jgi:porin
MLKFFASACTALLVTTTIGLAQQQPGSDVPNSLPVPSSPTLPPITADGSTAPTDATSGQNTDASTAPATAGAPSAVSSNPAANDLTVGTGALGRLLGFDKESGVRLGGIFIGDSNWLMSGGREPGDWTYDSLFVLDLSLDFEKLVGLKGGLFGIELLQYNGQPTNENAGVVMGYNSLDVRPPLNRTELYQLWWRQRLFDDKLTLRMGKLVPTYDFNNVSAPAPTDNPNAVIPSVSSLIFTPLFVNPTMLTKIPGYYNSADGIMGTYRPNKNWYLSFGAYDGSLATGDNTGLGGPRFDGHYFYIWEGGHSWSIGADEKPGNFAVGIWDQTGPLTAANGATVHGADGIYTFGAQRLWFARPGLDNSGVSGYFQAGLNNSNTNFVRQYVGGGLTGFGLVPNRPKDSMGCGMAWGFLNSDPNAGEFFFPHVASTTTSLRTNEVILQSYYQYQIRDGAYFEPALTYVPNPGERTDIKEAWATTLRLILLF